MDARRLALLCSLALALIPPGAGRCEAGWLSGRDGRLLPFRHRHECPDPCQPPPCLLVKLCECVPFLSASPCGPPPIPVGADAAVPAAVAFSDGAWSMSPTGHATEFLDSPWGHPSFPVELPPYSAILPPLSVAPPTGFGEPPITPPGGIEPPPTPGGPPGQPPPEPPGVVIRETPAPPAVVLVVIGVMGLVAFRRRFSPLSARASRPSE